jgi:hypothetical protein
LFFSFCPSYCKQPFVHSPTILIVACSFWHALEHRYSPFVNLRSITRYLVFVKPADRSSPFHPSQYLSLSLLLTYKAVNDRSFLP